MEIGDEVFHKVKPTISEKMIVIGLEEDEMGRQIKCRRYNSREKAFEEVTFREEELVLVWEHLKPYETLEEEIEYWKEMISLARGALKRAEERFKEKSGSE